MTDDVLYVVVRLRAKPEAAESLRQLWLALRDETRKETGCIRYRVLQNANDPTELVSLEEWVNEAAEAAHLATPHVQTIAPQLGPLLAEAPSIERYREPG